VRVGFSYFATDATIDYLIQAVHLIAEHGWKLLPHYSFDPVSGLWQHRGGKPNAAPALADVLTGAGLRALPRVTSSDRVLRRQLAAAERIFKNAKRSGARLGLPERAPEAGSENTRWFPLPYEVNAEYSPSCPPRSEALVPVDSGQGNLHG
jgi:hypothetical protein